MGKNKVSYPPGKIDDIKNQKHAKKSSFPNTFESNQGRQV